MPKAKSHNNTSAVNVLARLAAKKAVQDELRAQGVRVTLVSPARIKALAEEHLGTHPELHEVAIDRAWRMGYIDESTRDLLIERRRQQPGLLVTPDWRAELNSR